MTNNTTQYRKDEENGLMYYFYSIFGVNNNTQQYQVYWLIDHLILESTSLWDVASEPFIHAYNSEYQNKFPIQTNDDTPIEWVLHSDSETTVNFVFFFVFFFEI